MWCVISDLDGTLLTNQQMILPETSKSITQFTHQGHLFTLATGRSLQSVLPIIGELNLELPIILYNGARIYHPVKRQFIYEKSIELETVKKILKLYHLLSGLRDFSMLVFDQEGAYYLNWHPAIPLHEKKDGIKSREVSEEELIRKRVIKFVFLAQPHIIQGILPSFQAFNAVNSEPELLEILPDNVNKGEACQTLLNYLSLSNNQLVTVGDSNNDMEMLLLARHGMAVNNANALVKNVADHVTIKSNNDNAMGEILQWIQQEPIQA